MNIFRSSLRHGVSLIFLAKAHNSFKRPPREIVPIINRGLQASPQVEFLPPPKKITSFNTPFTPDQVHNFDANYLGKRKVEHVNLKRGLLIQHMEYSDIQKILQSKTQDNPSELVRFIKLRKDKIKLAEVWFWVKKLDQDSDRAEKYLQAMDEEVLDILNNFILKTQKISRVMAASLLRVCVLFNFEEEATAKMLQLYLQHLRDTPDQLIDLETVLKCPSSSLFRYRNTLFRYFKRNPAHMVRSFQMLTMPAGSQAAEQVGQGWMDEEYLRLYDNYFHENYDSLPLESKIDVLEIFSYLCKRGHFIQDLQIQLKEIWINSLEYKLLLKILVNLSSMRSLDMEIFSKFQEKVLKDAMNLTLSVPEIVTIIQIAHLSNYGSLEFWLLMRSQKINYRYNQCFAILGGYERNLATEVSLFLHMVSKDPEHQSFEAEVSQDQFLKMSLVYYFNLVKVEPEAIRTSISAKLVKKLDSICKTRPYKVFIRMLMWLVQTDPIKKQEWLKLMYTDDQEKILLSFAFPGVIAGQTSNAQTKNDKGEYIEILRQKYEYFDTHRERAVIEQYIRRKITIFQNNQHCRRPQQL